MAADQAPKRKSTQVGLGAVHGSGEHPTETRRSTVKLPAQTETATAPLPRMTLPVRVEAEPRALISDAPAEPTSTSSAPPSRVKSREPRQAIAVDDVGAAALDAQSRPPRNGKPKVVKSRRELAAAPIDPRDAFLLSFIDGKLSVASLVDVSGMGEGEVMAILARLRRLGIITYS
jgi:hypothetical protein